MELYHIMIAIKVKCKKKKLSCCFHCIYCVGQNSTAPGFYMNDSHLYMCCSTLFFNLLLATWEMENMGFDYLLWHQELFQKIILFQREEERERSFLSLVHYPSTNSWRSCQVEAQDQKLNPGLPHRWQEQIYLCLHLLPSRVLISRKLEQGSEWGIQPRLSDRKCEFPKWHVNCSLKHLLEGTVYFFNMRSYSHSYFIRVKIMSEYL